MPQILGVYFRTFEFLDIAQHIVLEVLELHRGGLAQIFCDGFMGSEGLQLGNYGGLLCLQYGPGWQHLL